MYAAFYKLLPANKNIADDNITLLNDNEVRFIRKTERIAIFLSACLGGIMVVLLYAPQYIFVKLFSTSDIYIPILNKHLEISMIAILYGIALVFTEVFLLTLLNIYCSHEIALSTGFINKYNKTTKEKQDFLLNIGNQKKIKEIHELGIDPYWGLNKTSVFLLNLLFSLKATLSNFIIRIIFQRILGRYAVRMVLDLIGIPVFAFWNAMGTAKVLKESRIIIMGVNHLIFFEKEISKFREIDSTEKSILYDTLKYIAISKRDYHKNHYVLSKIVMDRFSIKIEKNNGPSDEYEKLLSTCDEDFRKLNERILILGIILDGNVSYRESKRIKKLQKMKVLTTNKNSIKNMAKDFTYGKGIQQ